MYVWVCNKTSKTVHLRISDTMIKTKLTDPILVVEENKIPVEADSVKKMGEFVIFRRPAQLA